MRSLEPFISKKSDYYNYQPSLTGSRTFFYPIAIGHFYYEPGYKQFRNSFDSFLLMYVASGSLQVKVDDQIVSASENNFVLLDCYRPHGYFTDTDCECLWFHFDGPVAREYFSQIIEKFGIIFTVNNGLDIVQKIQTLYNIFRNNQVVREPAVSKLISDILTIFLLYENSSEERKHTNSIDEVLTYINEHFSETITIEKLAEQCSLSPYYFIRLFKKQTGFTPHEYIVNTRLNAAKYMLKSTDQNIKDICFSTGFSSESVFCTAFKKNVGQTPAQYRSHINN